MARVHDTRVSYHFLCYCYSHSSTLKHRLFLRFLLFRHITVLR